MSIIEKVEKLKKGGSNNLAVMELATHFNKDPELSPLLFFSPAQFENIEHTNRTALNQAIHILSLGQNFNIDEYIWVLTVRTNYQLVENYYRFYNLDINLVQELEKLDILFSHSLKIKSNKKNANSAARTIEKNRTDISPFFWKEIFLKLGLLVNI